MRCKSYYTIHFGTKHHALENREGFAQPCFPLFSHGVSQRYAQCFTAFFKYNSVNPYFALAKKSCKSINPAILFEKS
jgi:hypothetical protein